MAFTPPLKADGTPCCFRVAGDGRPAFPSQPCGACADHFARAASITTVAQEDGYAVGLSAIRTASERQMLDDREERFRAIEREAAEVSRLNDEAFLALADVRSDLDNYKAPDPWAAGLKALQSTK